MENGGNGCASPDPAVANFLPALGQDVLDRHEAKALSPTDVLVAPGWPAPRSTVYRTASLLVPDDLLHDPATLRDFNAVLEPIGLELVAPRPLEEVGKEPENFLKFRHLLPRPVRVRLRADAKVPATVDSWSALAYLRTAATAGRLPRQKVERVSVEHLMVGADLSGAPWDVHGLGGAPWDVHGLPGSSYQRSVYGGRIPVLLNADRPRRKHSGPNEPDRRPVIAVLDTGVGPHPWYDLPNRNTVPNGDFLAVSPTLQHAIQANSNDPLSLDRFWDEPVTDNPLIGDVAKATGHGTFITGIVRQAAADARVLAVRVLHSDSVAHEADVLFALWYIACGVQLAEESGKPASMVDILSLSIGYYDETTSPSVYTGQVTKIVDWFLSMGVLIVAAAGNDSTSREFYPAALASRPQPNGSGPQLISVGAQNPNGTNALFSNDGPWVRHWEPGAAVVSTYPIDVRGSGEPDSEPNEDREGLDPDDFSAGFAVWDGTSFAAPLAAAKLAASMLDSGAKLGAIDRDSTIKRAEQAAKSLA